MKTLKDDAGDIAASIADDIWHRFERDVEEIVGDEFVFETASAVSTALWLASDRLTAPHVSGAVRVRDRAGITGLVVLGWGDQRA
jgi:hypothetical protein